MKVCLISLGSVSSQRIAEALRKYFDQVDALDIRKIEVNVSASQIEILHDGNPLQDYDCIYAKGSFRYNPILRAIATAYHDKVYMPISPDAFLIGHDKILTHMKLQSAKIPMPKTYVAASVQAAKNVLGKVNYPIVMKFPSGTQGKGVMFAESYPSASSMLD